MRTRFFLGRGLLTTDALRFSAMFCSRCAARAAGWRATLQARDPGVVQRYTEVWASCPTEQAATWPQKAIWTVLVVLELLVLPLTLMI